MANVASVIDGKINVSESSQQTERSTGSELGKEEFLQLLVTQMKYQDPLEPTDNTEYVSQLAQFSELEQMQNLNQTTSNTSAFTLVGKEVYIEDESATGEVTSVQGTVEYVTLQNGKAYVSVNGTLYSYDSIVQVIDENYLIEQYIPTVTEQEVTYRHHDPQDIVVNGISLGSHGYEATSFAVVLVDDTGKTEAIDSTYLTYNNGKLSISKEVFKGLESGTYHLAFVFNDANSTVISDEVTLYVKGIRLVEEDADNGDNIDTEQPDTDNSETDKSDDTSDVTEEV